MSTATVCEKCNGTGYFEWKLNKCGVCDIADKAQAAIATLEHLGYEYNGGEQWKPPIKVDVTEQAMAKRQREINYWASLNNEKAASQYYKGDKVFVADPPPSPFDDPELWEKVETPRPDLIAARDEAIKFKAYYSRLKNEIIKEYLEAQQSEYK